MKFVRTALAGGDRSEPDGHLGRRGRPGGPSLPFLLLFAAVVSTHANPVIIGSKKIIEAYVLGEIAPRAPDDGGVASEHRQGMGGPILPWQALPGGQNDGHPEYTGTIREENLK